MGTEWGVAVAVRTHMNDVVDTDAVAVVAWKKRDVVVVVAAEGCAYMEDCYHRECSSRMEEMG
jgi:hypothetical protein